MARKPKLKVYRTPAGFHDAYVAAPSQKAALAAWGSEHDLFARGIAEQVVDPALTADALAAPGTVIRRSRGSAAEQIAAIPATRGHPVRKTKDLGDVASGTDTGPAPRKAAKVRPSKPKRDAVDQADVALEVARADRDRQLKAFALRMAALEREGRTLDRALAAAVGAAEAIRDAEQAVYDAALRTWRADR